MILLNPRNVALDANPINSVKMISVERQSTNTIVGQTDNGPHPTFVDVAAVRTRIVIARAVTASQHATSRPGNQHTLTFAASRTGSDADRTTHTAQVVVVSVTHDFSPRTGLVEQLAMLALSTDGRALPIATTNET